MPLSELEILQSPLAQTTLLTAVRSATPKTKKLRNLRQRKSVEEEARGALNVKNKVD